MSESMKKKERSPSPYSVLIDALQKKYGINNIALINNIIIKEINKTKDSRKDILEVSFMILA